LAKVVALDAKSPVLILYGVKGIGKTRLIEEAIRQLNTPRPFGGRAVTFLIDCDELKLPTPDALLQTIIVQGNEYLSGSWRSTDQAVHAIVDQLARLAVEEGSVYLFFDTTEALQTEERFWRWLESSLVVPLIPAAQVRFVFSGRVPAPWRSYEVRRALDYIQLDALPKEEAALALLEDCFRLYNGHLEPRMIEAALPLLYEISQGHPGLSEQLVRATVPLLPELGERVDDLERVLRAEVVESFIKEDLYGNLDPPWPEILTWASVLDDFDAYTLERYIHRVPELDAQVSGAPAYFYNQGVAEMRNRHALVWHSGQGYALYGVLQKIVRSQFEKLHSEQYERACRAAADTYQEFAEMVQQESEIARYREKAAFFGRLADRQIKEHAR
jgi:hypothetical protein